MEEEPCVSPWNRRRREHAARRSRRSNASLWQQFVSELLRGALPARGGGATAGRPRERYGFRPTPAGGAVVTNEVVNEIRDDLGV